MRKLLSDMSRSRHSTKSNAFRLTLFLPSCLSPAIKPAVDENFACGIVRAAKTSRGRTMKFAALTALLIAVQLTAFPAMAKKTSSQKGSGAYCSQGADNVFIPAAEFPAKYRNKLRKGQKAKFNIAGYGPVYCVVY
jgi:hypothetical protein